MIKKKYNNVADLMQYLKKQTRCTVRDLECDLSYSPNVICGVMNGINSDLVHYETVVQYFLKQLGWTVDVSEVLEMVQLALSKKQPLVVGVLEQKNNFTGEYRFVLMKID